MTKSCKGRNFTKCSVGSGKKGTLLIRKTNMTLRKHRAANIAAANAAKKNKVEDIIDDRLTVISDLTPQSVYTQSTVSTDTSISSTTFSFNTSIIERGRYKKRGSSFNKFMDDGLDWRSFGSYTFDGMMNDGIFSILMKKISIYKNARTNKARHKAVICSSELPLSEAASRQLDTKMRVVELIMNGIKKDPSGGVTKLSVDIGLYYTLDPAVVREYGRG